MKTMYSLKTPSCVLKREFEHSSENPKSRARIRKVARESEKSRENPKSRARIRKVARESRKLSGNPTKPHNLSGLGLFLIYFFVNIISVQVVQLLRNLNQQSVLSSIRKVQVLYSLRATNLLVNQ